MPEQRYYYIDTDAKVIQHFDTQVEAPEGFTFCGMSQLGIKAAAGFYARNEDGYTIVDGNPQESETTNDSSGDDIPET